MSTTDKMIRLFQEYRGSLGLADDRERSRQCEFEDKFAELICEAKGHDLGPDMYNKPEHDLCYVCDQLASDLGFERDGQGGYRECVEKEST